jgi:hypothetical protein
VEDAYAYEQQLLELRRQLAAARQEAGEWRQAALELQVGRCAGRWS